MSLFDPVVITLSICWWNTSSLSSCMEFEQVCCCSPNPGHLTSAISKISHRRHCSSYMICFTLPHWCNVWTFQVPMDISSQFYICFGSNSIFFFFLLSLSWRLSVVFDPSLDRSGMMFTLRPMSMVLSLSSYTCWRTSSSPREAQAMGQSVIICSSRKHWALAGTLVAESPHPLMLS